MSKPAVVVIAGPTAVGKTSAAIAAANRFDGEIVSCDSMQIYKFMDIGSAKPTEEEQRQAKHHLIDCIDPREPFSAARFAPMARECIREISSRGKLPIVAGGTGLYLDGILYDLDFNAPPENPARRAELQKTADEKGAEALHELLENLDTDAADHIHPHNIQRLIRAIEIAEGGGKWRDFSSQPVKNDEMDFLLICLCRNREELYERINLRVDLLMEAGLAEEVDRLLDDYGLSEDNISMKGIGYKELIACRNGECTRDEAVELIKKNTRHFAKRQLTWFRRYDDMHWLNISDFNMDKDFLNALYELIGSWLDTR